MFQSIGRQMDAERHVRQLASSYLLFAVVHGVAAAWAAWWIAVRLFALLVLAWRWLFATPEMVFLEPIDFELVVPEVEELSVVEVAIGDLDERGLADPEIALAPPEMVVEPVLAPRAVLRSEAMRESTLLLALIGTTGESEFGTVSNLFGDSLDDRDVFGGLSGVMVADSGFGSGGLGLSGTGRGGGGTGEGTIGIGTIGHGSGGGGGGSGQGYGASAGGLATVGSMSRAVTHRERPQVAASTLEANGVARCSARVSVGDDGVPTRVAIVSCPDAYRSAVEAAVRGYRWEKGRGATSERVTVRLSP